LVLAKKLKELWQVIPGADKADYQQAKDATDSANARRFFNTLAMLAKIAGWHFFILYFVLK